MPGQDYANQRYYNTTSGSYWSPDPGGIHTADPGTPISWNRYPYAGGDPINHRDPSGLELFLVNGNCSLDGQDVDCSQLCDSTGNLMDAYAPLYQDQPNPCSAASGGGGDGDSETGADDNDPSKPCDAQFLTAPIGGFSASDINFAARVVFAESSGNKNEDTAIADVIYNRLNNKLFSGGTLQTLTAVVSAPGQFNAVTSPGPSGQFIASAPSNYQNLDPADCDNLKTAIAQMASVVQSGPTATYNSFRAASTHHAGTVIGGSVFWTQSPPKPRKRRRGEQ